MTDSTEAARIVASTRLAVALIALGAVVLVPLAVALEIRADLPPTVVGGATLFGLAAPAIGWRIHAVMRDRASRIATDEARARKFLPATVVALAVTEAAALVGLVVYSLTREPAPLVGPAMHVILSGALWPSDARLDAFVRVESGGST